MLAIGGKLASQAAAKAGGKMATVRRGSARAPPPYAEQTISSNLKRKVPLDPTISTRTGTTNPFFRTAPPSQVAAPRRVSNVAPVTSPIAPLNPPFAPTGNLISPQALRQGEALMGAAQSATIVGARMANRAADVFDNLAASSIQAKNRFVTGAGALAAGVGVGARKVGAAFQRAGKVIKDNPTATIAALGVASQIPGAIEDSFEAEKARLELMNYNNSNSNSNTTNPNPNVNIRLQQISNMPMRPMGPIKNVYGETINPYGFS